MSVEAAVAILAAMGTFIGAVVLAVRGLSGDKFNRKVTESAALLTGYTEMVANLRKEIDAMRVSHSAEAERISRQHRTEVESVGLMHAEERERWVAERERLEERIETLEAQVTALLFRRPDTRERSDDGGT